MGLVGRGDFRHDVYIFAKTYTAASCLLAWRMRQCGKPVGVDVFDDYFTQTANARMLRYRSWFAAMAGLMDFFLCSTERLGEAIRQLLGGKPLAVIADPAEGFDVQQLETVCQQLHTLLAADDGNAERVLNQHAVLLAAAFGQQFTELQEAINQFDAQRGLTLLTAAMAHLSLGK